MKKIKNLVTELDYLNNQMVDSYLKGKEQPKDESKEVKEGGELFIGGEWEYSVYGDKSISIWSNPISAERTLIAEILASKDAEANAALLVESKNMYYILKEIRNWYEENAYRLAPDTPICFSKALSVLKKVNRNY